ncbi:Hypothetical predicted protein [Mytilus galloprovincialis]|nr:Hypothetical predicted protein [Mytilus galloprovincialis]
MNSELLYLTNTSVAAEFEWATYACYVYPRIIQQMISCYQSSHQYVYAYNMSLWCSGYAQTIPLTSLRRSNKHKYKQYNSCFSTLLQTIYRDAVSGWLMLASFFYMVKQYDKALHILVYSLSKFTPEKLYSFMEMSDIHNRLLKLKSFQKKKIVRIWKIMLVDYMKFYQNSWLIPHELQMEVKYTNFSISSIVYAYFLQFLCHHHRNEFRQCQDCLHTLKLVIAEHYCIEGQITFKSAAYNILVIALQLSGDHEAARQAFIHSVDIFPNENTSIKRLELMSS